MLALKGIHVCFLQKGLKSYMLLSQNWLWLIQALYYLKGDGNLALKKNKPANKPKLSVSKCHGLCCSLNTMQVALTVFVIVTVMPFL